MELDLKKWDNETEVVLNPKDIFNECLIDASEELPKPPIAISIGYKYEEHVPLVTYGNFCAVVGASKSMKSFFKSALLACYIGGQAQNYFIDIKGHDTKGKYVIDIDTEQGKYHVQKAVKRVHTMIGGDYKGYQGFALRPKTSKERVVFIEWLLKESEYSGKIGLLSIDGIADLVEDVNDLKESNEITQKLMTWSNDYNIAIITVIHKNFGTEKATGHLGSSVLKKAECVCFVDKSDKIVTVVAKYSRNIPFDDFTFTVNEHGIPHNTGIDF
jgi:hypothetical protein